MKAAGTLLCHLPFICRHTTRERAQVWSLAVAQKNCEDIWGYLDTIAQKHGQTSQALFERHKLSKTDLQG